MAPDIGSTGLVASIRLVEIFDIVGLKNEDNDPVYACNDRVKGKRRIMVIVLTPNCMAMMVPLAILWSSKGIVDACYDH